MARVQFVAEFDGIEEATLAEGLVPLNKIDVYSKGDGVWVAETTINGKEYSSHNAVAAAAVVDLLRTVGVQVNVGLQMKLC